MTNDQTSPTPKMRWRDQPIYAQTYAVAFVVSAIAGLWVLMAETNYFVSATCVSALKWPSLVVAGVLGLCTFWSMRYIQRTPELQVARLRALSPFTRLFLVPAAFFGYLSWIQMVAVSDIGNRIVGQPFSGTFVVAGKSHEQSRRGGECYRVDLRELADDWYGRLCVQADHFARIEPGATIALYGTKSWFGTMVVRYAVR